MRVVSIEKFNNQQIIVILTTVSGIVTLTLKNITISLQQHCDYIR